VIQWFKTTLLGYVEMAQKSNENKFHASLFPGKSRPLLPEFASAVLGLEKELGMPIWTLIQDAAPAPLEILNREVWRLFNGIENDLPKDSPIALLIDSPGGFAKESYQIARLLVKRCGKFVALVPRYAKSAATLLLMGADEIYMGRHAELGPLDVQFFDANREETVSALDTVHSLQRLKAFALETVDEAMFLMIGRTAKKTEKVLPHTLHFVAELVKPLLDQIDVIEYTKMSRDLKVAEEYAVRLLANRNSMSQAITIASHFVEHYPEHGFFIAPEEARQVGMPVRENSEEVDNLLDQIFHLLETNQVTSFGKVVEEALGETRNEQKKQQVHESGNSKGS